jgi:osmotically-inducible protein OsmY
MRVTYTGVAMALSLALGAGACNRAQVPDPTERTEQALEQANIPDVDVEWDDEARIAHLKGTVNDARQREQAEEVATNAVGTAGKVLNEIEVAAEATGTSGHSALGDDMDSRLHDALGDAVDRDPVLRDRDIDFDVNNGAVTVKGEVRTAAEKTRVSEIVQGMPGVKDFANALEIEPQK